MACSRIGGSGGAAWLAWLVTGGLAMGCGGSSNEPGFNGGSDSGGATYNPLGSDAGGDAGSGGNPPPLQNDGGFTPDTGTVDGGVTITTTIYAHTDRILYSMDPATKAVAEVGTFAGMGGGSNDSTITDLAVNGAGDIYVNTESVLYKAALPATTPGTVQLTQVKPISGSTNQRFYALAFTPAGALGSDEALIGGDINGELWAIDVATGNTTDLGSFGPDPSTSGNILSLSGDLVFFNDSTGKPTGLATIRSCTPATTSTGSPKCSTKNDFLAGVDMTAMATAFSTKQKQPTLNGGIYGGSATQTGAGIGYGDVFGLGAWEGNVYGFTRSKTPQLVLIDATTNGGGGTPVASGSITLASGDNGWNGAGVTTKVQVKVGMPPPPPPPK